LNTCPHAAEHTLTPTGYVAAQSWAAAMLKARWRQDRCRGCGRYEMWTPPYPDAPLPRYQDWAFGCFNCGSEAAELPAPAQEGEAS